MRKSILAATLSVLATLPSPALAVEEIQQTCTPFYGGGVVCGAHTPVETGFVSSVLFSVAAVLFLIGLALFIIARKIRRVYLLE